MKQKIALVLSILFGLMFINSGLNKFFNYLPQPEDMPENIMSFMDAIMATGWMFPLIATVETIGGLLIMIPKTRALGAIMIFPIMLSIVLFHAVQAPDTLIVALILFVINLWLVFENRAKYMHMIGE